MFAKKVKRTGHSTHQTAIILDIPVSLPSTLKPPVGRPRKPMQEAGGADDDASPTDEVAVEEKRSLHRRCTEAL